MDFATADLSDNFSRVVQVAEPLFRDFGGRRAFFGAIATLKVFEDNSLVRTALEESGRDRVLVVDGGASVRCALVGDQLAALGARNGWAGVVVNGCVRDTRILAETDFGVKALVPHPVKSVKRGEGSRDVAITFAGVTFRPGHYLYADEDGILVAEDRLL